MKINSTNIRKTNIILGHTFTLTQTKKTELSIKLKKRSLSKLPEEQPKLQQNLRKKELVEQCFFFARTLRYTVLKNGEIQDRKEE